MPRTGRRRVRLRRTRRREPRLSRQSFTVDPNQIDPHAPRAGRWLHGGHLRAPQRQGWRLYRHARARRHQPRDRVRLRPAGRHADDDDHRPEAHQEIQARPLPDPRRRRDDGADHQIHPPAGLRRQHSLAHSRGFPAGRGREAGSGPPRASRGCRRRADGEYAAGSQRRPPSGRGEQSDPGRREEDRIGHITAAGHRLRRQPNADGAHAAAVHRKDRNPLRQHPARQRRRRRAESPIRRLRSAVVGRLLPSCDRGRRRHHQRRSRRHRKAAVLHEARRHGSDPRQFVYCRSRSGLLPAGRSDRRHRQRHLADEGRHRSPGHLGLHEDVRRRGPPKSPTPPASRTTSAVRSIRRIWSRPFAK